MCDKLVKIMFEGDLERFYINSNMQPETRFTFESEKAYDKLIAMKPKNMNMLSLTRDWDTPYPTKSIEYEIKLNSEEINVLCDNMGTNFTIIKDRLKLKQEEENHMFKANKIKDVFVNEKKKTVTVILKDGRKGTSKCLEDDVFDEYIGLVFAYDIAMASELQSKKDRNEQIIKALKKVRYQ